MDLHEVAGNLGPDVLTLEKIRPQPVETSGNGPAAAEAAEPDRYARRHNRIAIRHRSGDRVDAISEIASPGNKASRHALRSFVEKAIELLDAGIHLLIVDLFPPGPRDPQDIHGAIWSEYIGDDFQLPPGRPLTLVSYSAGDLRQSFIEPTAVGEVLPEMPLFLEPRLDVPVPQEATSSDGPRDVLALCFGQSSGLCPLPAGVECRTCGGTGSGRFRRGAEALAGGAPIRTDERWHIARTRSG